MEYKIFVPVMNSNITKQNREEYVKMFRDCSAARIFIAIDRYILFEEDRREFLSSLGDNIKYFTDSGFETGVWLQAFGFGDTLSPVAEKKAINYTPLKSVSGRVIKNGDAFCPSNENFVNDYCTLIKDIASLNPSMIMLDDDLCLSVRPGLGCFCDNHMKMLSDKIGKSHTLDEIRDNIFTGGKNIYRDIYLSVMGDTLRNFCRKVRETIDSVNPNIRAGLCAGYTSWDIEGADSSELSVILAGNLKPFLRFTGAPYWVSKDVVRFGGLKLSTVIECTRAQEKWCRNKGIESFK